MSSRPQLVDHEAPEWCNLAFPPLADVPCRHANESIIATITNGPRRLITIGFLLNDPDKDPRGVFIAIGAEEARLIAAGLVEKANELDRGKGKQ